MTDRERPMEPDPAGAGRATSRLALPGWAYDVFVCACLAAVGVWFFMGALALPPGRRAVDSATIPLFTSAILVLLCLIQALLSFRSRRRSVAVEFERPLQVAIAMILIVLFPTAIERFGYYLTTALWLPAFGWIAGLRSPLALAAVAVAVLAIARFVFEMLLGTPLP
jgi:hypothetical protein